MFGYHLSSRQQVGKFRKPLRGVLVGLLVPFLFSGLLNSALGAGTPGFQVVMVSPQRFHIQPLISGPVSSSLVGSGGNQTLITRQENGRTVIDAEVPVGATLRLQVGSRSMNLRMVDSRHYTCWED